MPAKRRMAKVRLPRLDDLAEWELAFIEERLDEDLQRSGKFACFWTVYGPPAWGGRTEIARCLALWEARNDHRRKRGLAPVWPDDTSGLRTLDESVPFRHPRPHQLEEVG